MNQPQISRTKDIKQHVPGNIHLDAIVMGNVVPASPADRSSARQRSYSSPLSQLISPVRPHGQAQTTGNGRSYPFRLWQCNSLGKEDLLLPPSAIRTCGSTEKPNVQHKTQFESLEEEVIWLSEKTKKLELQITKDHLLLSGLQLQFLNLSTGVSGQSIVRSRSKHDTELAYLQGDDLLLSKKLTLEELFYRIEALEKISGAVVDGMGVVTEHIGSLRTKIQKFNTDEISQNQYNTLKKEMEKAKKHWTSSMSSAMLAVEQKINFNDERLTNTLNKLQKDFEKIISTLETSNTASLAQINESHLLTDSKFQEGELLGMLKKNEVSKVHTKDPAEGKMCSMDMCLAHKSQHQTYTQMEFGKLEEKIKSLETSISHIWGQWEEWEQEMSGEITKLKSTAPGSSDFQKMMKPMQHRKSMSHVEGDISIASYSFGNDLDFYFEAKLHQFLKIVDTKISNGTNSLLPYCKFIFSADLESCNKKIEDLAIRNEVSSVLGSMICEITEWATAGELDYLTEQVELQDMKYGNFLSTPQRF